MLKGLSRREWLANAGGGFGSVALAAWLSGEQSAFPIGGDASVRQEGLHHPARVKRVIQLFMNGGASPMDTFDYKPALEKHHGQMLGPAEKPEGFTAPAGAVMKSPFEFQQYGETGRWVSSVFPHQARIVDQLTFLMAMTSKSNVHGPASYMMNTGFILPGFPSMGSWISYAIGSVREELPAFVVLPDPRGLPYNQKGNFSSGFLPAQYQGTILDVHRPDVVPHLHPAPGFEFAQGAADSDTQRLLLELNRQHALKQQNDSQLESQIAAGELAAKMQLAAPQVFDLSSESAATLQAYGLEQEATADFGKRCLMARRLIERGTRFVQVWSGPQGAVNNWDNHGSIPNELPPMALSVDQPIVALVEDLRARGLLDDTLVIWTTEFGRTPFAQGGVGRDHNRGTFVTWMVGAGVRPGVAVGESDELGYQAAVDKTDCHDFHATVLHLLGIDHERLVVRTGGIDRRLTDVHGRVIEKILA
ncbi:MAG: DUF1501 domain-containing protein [Planctomycetaceae bacterium]|nr:DUF1501 domain-containing protein [Planctomycetaceae bacterium]